MPHKESLPASNPGNYRTPLRFFNVVDTGAPELLDNSVENLVPIVINKLKAGELPVIYGIDYPTPDGTCVRDYVDVRDIASAHLAAAVFLTGVVALEVKRRAGDPAFLCAEVSLMRRIIEFEDLYTLEQSTLSLSKVLEIKTEHRKSLNLRDQSEI